MSEEQQRVLLKGDQELELELQRELEFVQNSVETADIQQRFYTRRSIAIVIESLAIDDFDKPDLPTDFSMASNHSLQVTQYAQLIPHFGTLKRPRRWMKPIRDFEHVSYMGETEFADPIYVVPAKFQAAGGPIVMPTSTSTGSDDSMELIKQWLALADPENRRFEAPGHFIPSRLVDVSQVASTGLVRVRSRSDVFQDTPNPIYVALSHCWGNAQEFPFLVLKKSNFHNFARGISVKKLTKTFQEAVSVTQRLGYDYLWADSLCIVQDSDEDWLQEADTMCEVYMHAAFTIAATAAWDGREGLFRTQKPLENSPCLLMVNEPRGWNRRDRVLQTFYAIPAHTDIARSREIEIMRSRWHRRAWVFQEKILSSRIVHFAERQLHFDVLNVTREDPFSQIHSQYDEQIYFERNPARALRDTKQYARSLWPDFVTDYTQRDLSMRKDKLIAISGLVRSLVTDVERRERYVAGLWTSYLMAGLLWYVNSDRHLTRPSSHPKFPSWSWASVDGRIYSDSLDLDPAASGLSKAEVVKPPGNSLQGGKLSSLGDVPEGTHVIVIGKLRKAQWAERPGNYYISRSQEFMELRGHPSENLVHNRGATEEWVAVCGAVMRDSSMGPSAYALLTLDNKQIGWFLPDAHDGIPPLLYCLQIKVVPESEEMKADPFLLWVVRGLALTPTGKAPNEYSRVGYFELDYQSNGLLWPDMTTGPLSKRAPWLPVRRPPTIDPYGFFGPDCPEMEIKLV